MNAWRVDDLMILAGEIRLTGPTFTVRRVLQRLERDEITPLQAAELVARSRQPDHSVRKPLDVRHVAGPAADNSCCSRTFHPYGLGIDDLFLKP